MAIPTVQGVINDPSKLKDIFGSTPQTIGEIPIDVVIAETPVFSWGTTSHKIDVGIAATDMRYKKPIGLVLDCVFTSQDFSLKNIGLSTLKGENPFNQATWDEKALAVKALAEADGLIEVVTSNDSYVNMSIKDIKPIYKYSESDCFVFRVTFEELQLVYSEMVDVDSSLIPKDEKKASKKLGKAAKLGKKTATKTAEKPKSILVKLIDKLRG